MTPIKFRAWDKIDGRFLDENDNTPNFLNLVPCDTTGQFTPMYMTIESSNTYETDLVLTQFTGLLDKNGEEIYEGDIIDYEDVGSLLDSGVYAVEYIKGMFSPIGDFYDITWPMEWGTEYTCKIVGNIYQSPELLNKNND